MRLVMLGTGEFALPTFRALLDAGRDLAALVTQPDRPQGRKQEIVPSAIKQEALRRGVRVEQPEAINAPEGVSLIQALEPDLLVTAAYGQILSAEVLTVPRLGGINLHGSILPSYRGAAPVARAIQNGEPETGVTVIRMTARVDAGGMIAVARTAIEPDETAGALEDRLAQLGAPLVVQVVRDLEAGTVTVLPQEKARVTKAPKLTKEDGAIDWSRPARAVHDLARAMQPWPIARTRWLPAEPGKEPVALIVHRTAVGLDAAAAPGPVVPPGTVLEATGDRLVVAAGTGQVRLLVLQVPGKKPVPVADFLRGHRVRPGDRLG